LRTVTPSSWEAGDAWREPLEIGRFREWPVNLRPSKGTVDAIQNAFYKQSHCTGGELFY
jgi:hypothetical protein